MTSKYFHRTLPISFQDVEDLREAGYKFDDFECNWDWKTLEDVTACFERMGEKLEGFMITDTGPHCSPRFDIVEKPKVGDKISYAFNGDYHPCGEIAKISKTMKKITSTEGDVFYRRRATGCWLKNKYWAMIDGHHDVRNPHI